MSGVEPAANGTISLTGFVGHVLGSGGQGGERQRPERPAAGVSSNILPGIDRLWPPCVA